jgi:hypothetical protein
MWCGVVCGLLICISVLLVADLLALDSEFSHLILPLSWASVRLNLLDLVFPPPNPPNITPPQVRVAVVKRFCPADPGEARRPSRGHRPRCGRRRRRRVAQFSYG